MAVADDEEGSAVTLSKPIGALIIVLVPSVTDAVVDVIGGIGVTDPK